MIQGIANALIGYTIGCTIRLCYLSLPGVIPAAGLVACGIAIGLLIAVHISAYASLPETTEDD